MSIALILPVRDHWDYAQRTAETFLQSAAGHNPRVIVCDDCSQEPCPIGETPQVAIFRSSVHEGLTAQWNRGLRVARELDIEWAICGNSDTLFVGDWVEVAIGAASQTHLVGPVSNCPGWGAGNLQYVGFWVPGYELTDAPAVLAGTAEQLAGKKPILLPPIQIKPHSEGVVATVSQMLNGFTLLARTKNWWRGAFSSQCVFNPRFKMEHNELELQLRWAAAGKMMAVVPAWFVFHYRSVTRGEEFCTLGSYR